MPGSPRIVLNESNWERPMANLECPDCSSANVININLTMEDGEPVAFYSCHQCEHRWWDREGEPLDLPAVLELARREKAVPRRS